MHPSYDTALRERIGEHIDVSGARLTDDETEFLSDFVDGYNDEYRGRSETRTKSFTSWSSDGKYTRGETFTDDVGIRSDYSYLHDDGQSGESSTNIKDARGILTWFHNRS